MEVCFLCFNNSKKKKIMKIDFNKALNYTLLAYALLLPISRAAVVLLTIFAMLFWILEGNLKQKLQKITECKFIIAILIFIIYSFITLLWVEDRNISHAIEYIRKYWYLLIIIPIYTSMNKKNLIKVIYLFLTGLTISAFLSAGMYFHFWELKEVTPGSYSPFMHHVMLSFFLCFGALLLVILVIDSPPKNRNFFYLLFISFTIISGILFIGIGRTGQVIFIFILLVLLYKHFKNSKKIFIGITLFLIAFLISLYYLNDRFQTRVNLVVNDIEQITKYNKYCNSIGGRVFTWKITEEIIKDHPFIGLGIGDHLEYLRKRITSDQEYSRCGNKNMLHHFHGQYIEIASQSGIIGVLLFLYIFYTLMKVKIPNPLYNDIKLLVLLSFLLFFIVDMPFRRQFSLALFALFSAMVIRFAKIYGNESNKNNI